jgi:Flp pilus assembly pilin Flp
MLEEVPVFVVRKHSSTFGTPRRLITMAQIFRRLFHEEQGQDIAEYAVMLAVILVIVVGTIRLIGSNANTVFSQVASSVQ